MMSTKVTSSELLYRLIQHHVSDPEHNEDAVKRLYRFALRLLDGSIESALSTNWKDLASLVTDQVNSKRGTAAAGNVLRLLNTVKNSTSIKRKAAVMHLFLMLEGEGSRNSSAASSASLIDPAHNPLHTLAPTTREVPLVDAFRPKDTAAVLRAPSDDQLGSDSKASANDEQQQTKLEKKRIAAVSGGDQELSEEALVRDMLLALQGLNGRHIKYNASVRAFCVDKIYTIQQPHRDLVEKLSKAGVLFNQVSAFLSANERDAAFGLIGHSFCSAVANELSDYFRFIALLETQLDETSQQEQGNLTLCRLVVWLQTPLERLTHLVNIIQSVSGLRGGQLLSSLFSFCTHGADCMRSLARRLLQQAMPPFLDMLNEWMFRGVLMDSTNEFFVACDDHIAADPEDAHDYWSRKFFIRQSMLPSFVPQDMARHALLGGKSINFIRIICGHTEDFMQPLIIKSGPLTAIEWTNDTLRRGVLPCGDIVIEAYKLASNTLLRVMKEGFKLPLHVRAMRRYLLLGQGDLFVYLMDQLKQELDFPADHLLRHSLTAILDGALRNSNAKHDDPDVLKRLDIRLLEALQYEKGWDIFSLSYATDGPISAVFSPYHLFTYLKVFKFLWRVKRVDFVLSAMWSKQMVETKTFRGIKGIQSILQKVYLLGAEMVHFVRQIQHYLLFEVLETQWQGFMEAYDGAADLDTILTAHDAFLGKLEHELFVSDTESAQNKKSQLRSIFDLIFKFQEIHSLVHAAGMDEIDRRMRGAYQLRTAASRRKYGLGLGDASEDDHAAEEYPGSAMDGADLKKKLDEADNSLSVLSNTYESMVTTFLGLLSNEDGTENTKSLRSRIDFNAHYSFRLREKALNSHD